MMFALGSFAVSTLAIYGRFVPRTGIHLFVGILFFMFSAAFGALFLIFGVSRHRLAAFERDLLNEAYPVGDDTQAASLNNKRKAQ
jgi:hypothetical protein